MTENVKCNRCRKLVDSRSFSAFGECRDCARLAPYIGLDRCGSCGDADVLNGEGTCYACAAARKDPVWIPLPQCMRCRRGTLASCLDGNGLCYVCNRESRGVMTSMMDPRVVPNVPGGTVFALGNGWPTLSGTEILGRQRIRETEALARALFDKANYSMAERIDEGRGDVLSVLDKMWLQNDQKPYREQAVEIMSWVRL